MNRSAGEMRAELLKAARGAGAQLGTAEDLAVASAWMGAEALEQVVALLETAPERLDEMAAQLDDPSFGPPAQGDLPLALAAARAGDAMPSAWPKEVPDALWTRLAALSARIYVPESEASRRAGAGAGDIDND